MRCGVVWWGWSVEMEERVSTTCLPRREGEGRRAGLVVGWEWRSYVEGVSSTLLSRREGGEERRVEGGL